MNWYETHRSAFESAAEAALRDAGAELDESGFALDAYLDKWAGHRGGYDRFETLTDAINDFTNWTKSGLHNMPESASSEAEISVSITVNAGPVNIAYGTSRRFYIKSSNERRAAFDVLSRAVWADLQAYAAQRGLQIGQASATTTATASDTEQIEISSISHDVADGKHYIKVKGGPFTRWGVPVYPEALQAAGIDQQSIPLGTTEVNGHAKVLKKDGRVKKVIELVITSGL